MSTAVASPRAARYMPRHHSSSELTSQVGQLPRTGGQPIDELNWSGSSAAAAHAFGDVRIHADAASRATTRRLDAEALTVGRHIYLGATAPPLSTPRGRRLMAHELGHVLQSPPGSEAGSGTSVARASPFQEVQARSIGDRLLAGDPIRDAGSDPRTQLVMGLEQLFARTAADQVEQLLGGVGPSDPGASGEALDYLRTLDTEDLVDTLAELDRRGSLERIAGALTLGDRSALAGATFAVLYLSREARSAWGLIAARAIAALPASQRLELLTQVLRSIGRADEIADLSEGLAALDESDRVRASEPEEVVEPDAPPVSASVFAGVPIGPWNPGNQPIPFYLGNAAHVSIAAFYASSHLGDAVFSNFVPISTIRAAAVRLGLAPAATVSATAEQLDLKPDIANLTRAHLYEIKPTTLQTLGRAEARLYQAAFAAAGVLLALGPTGEPGTAGTIAAPGGWYTFSAPEPGVITYGYRQPPRRRVRVRAPSPAFEPVPDKSFRQRMAEITGLSGVALTIYIIISEGSRVIPIRNAIPVP